MLSAYQVVSPVRSVPSPFREPVYVTRPFLPPLEDFKTGLEEIWKNRWLTNDGPVIRRFEQQLNSYFNTSNLSVFSNGTLALQIGLQGLEIKGEVITTPFTFVATTHALFWNKIRPVFCDIDDTYFNIDPDKVESLITPWTSAILAVHTFGNPCNLQKLRFIAKKHGLTLIYDAAHAFGVQVDDRPISDFGDMSMFSFHATKTYHTFEGGMLVFSDESLKKKVNYLKNFGFENEVEVVMPGTNAKMSEIHALMGIYMLKHIDGLIDKRKSLVHLYKSRFSEIQGIITVPEIDNVKHNYSYMPILINEEEFGCSRDHVYNELKKYNIFSRRYFYPLITDFPCYKSIQVSDSLSVAKRVASQVLTVPLYNELESDDVNKICDIIDHIKKTL